MRFQHMSPMYAFATENIAGYFTQIDFNDKSVLTVCGSGDQFINAYLMGAREVTCFDINQNAKHIAELKRVGIEALTFEDYLRFFMRGSSLDLNANVFNYTIYEGFRRELQEGSRDFFDSLYEEFNFDGFQIRNGNSFNNSYDSDRLKIFSNPYLQLIENFNRTKNQIKPFKWIQTDIRKLEKMLESRKFDVILLSNVSDYAKEMFPESENYLERYFREIVLPLRDRHVEQNGSVIAGYVYNYREKSEELEFRSQIDNPIIRDSILRDIKHKVITFPSVIERKSDSVIVL